MMSTTRATRRAAATVAVAVALAAIAGFAPVQPADAAQLTGTFTSRISVDTNAATVLANTDSLTKTIRPATRSTTRISKPAPVTRRTAATTTRTSSTGTTTSSTSTGSTTAAPADETAQARSILAGYIGQYPILAGTTVTFGDAQGHQAICYYKSGRIVISPSHTSSLSRIIGHEIWHVIDWRDNGVIDWGENVPPR